MIDSNTFKMSPAASALSIPRDEDINEINRQISGPREYRIQDVWGDDPVESPVPLPEAVFPSPASSAVKHSWPRRLLIRLFGLPLIET